MRHCDPGQDWLQRLNATVLTTTEVPYGGDLRLDVTLPDYSKRPYSFGRTSMTSDEAAKHDPRLTLVMEWSGIMKVTFDELNTRYETLTAVVRCECVFATEMVGGQPADEDGIRQFVQYHLKIADPVEQDKAVKRIMHEEVQDVAPEEGELPEGKLYGLRAIRRTEHGPYIGDWMIKACLKNALSRLQIFKQHKGSKGNFAEAGRVRAWKYSLQDPVNPNFIFVRNSTDAPAHTSHKEFMGRVQTPQGPVSIIHQSEVCEPGSRFAFEIRFLNDNLKVNLKDDDIKDVLALAMIVGLGSARSLERGKFRIETAEIEL